MRFAPESITDVRTLVDLVEFRRRVCGDRVFLEIVGEEVSFEALARQAEVYAATLVERGVGRGDRVAILLPTCKEFLFAFFGIQRLAAVAVPLYPNSPPERLGRILDDSGARVLLGSDLTLPPIAARLGASSPDTIQIDLEAFRERATEGVEFPEPRPDDLSFLQYTSGSTGEPKGVRLTHANLVANVRAIMQRVNHHPDEVGVSWLPLYHDMGLIGFIFGPLWSASKVVVLPPSMHNPGLWLQAISRHRAQFTGAPDFAYRLCNLLPRVDGLDLSSLRLAYSGGEPVRASTVRVFHEKFGLRDVIVPAYGLAETALCVSVVYPGMRVTEDAHGSVCVGRPIPGTEVRIVKNGETLLSNQVGEIEVRAASNTSGYWGREDDGTLLAADGYLRTGDLGYLDPEGNLYVVGRRKNLIIRGGHNIAPRELEEAADAVPEVRFTAAVGVELERFGGSEQVLLFAEARDVSLSQVEYARIDQKIRKAIKERAGFFPNQVYLLKPRTIPRTPNGKVQHVLLRDAFVGGQLEEAGSILYPTAS
jgi:acyl-CoA synthetase (AMP-forming)/AMP-acid ligase II